MKRSREYSIWNVIGWIATDKPHLESWVMGRFALYFQSAVNLSVDTNRQRIGIG
jgi:hypothetical protein